MCQRIEQLQEQPRDLRPFVLVEAGETAGVRQGQSEPRGAVRQRALVVQWNDVGMNEPCRGSDLELEQLAEIMESRLEQMPRNTIEELVAILQRYLEESR